MQYNAFNHNVPAQLLTENGAVAEAATEPEYPGSQTQPEGTLSPALKAGQATAARLRAQRFKCNIMH